MIRRATSSFSCLSYLNEIKFRMIRTNNFFVQIGVLYSEMPILLFEGEIFYCSSSTLHSCSEVLPNG